MFTSGPMGPAAQDVPTTSICYKCNKPCDSDTLRCHITRGCNSVQKQRQKAVKDITTATEAAMRKEALLKMSEDFYGEHISKHEEALQKFLESKGVAVAKESKLQSVLAKYQTAPDPMPMEEYPYDVPPLPMHPLNPWESQPINIPNMQQITAGGGSGAAIGAGPEYYGGGGAGPTTYLNLPVNAPKPVITEIIVMNGQYYNLSEAGITIMNKSGKRLRFKVEEA